MGGTRLDRKLFGLPETYTLSELKQRYRELLKLYHPDLHNGDAEYHRRIIGLNEAYGRMMQTVSKTSGNKDAPPTGFYREPGQNGLVRHKDPAYVYYKEGMRHYRKIYPISRPRVVKDLFRISQPVLKPEEEAKKLDMIFSAFSRAIYYFTVVTAEFENSVWYADSEEKVAFLMRHLKRYRIWKENLINTEKG